MSSREDASSPPPASHPGASIHSLFAPGGAHPGAGPGPPGQSGPASSLAGISVAFTGRAGSCGEVPLGPLGAPLTPLETPRRLATRTVASMLAGMLATDP